MNVHLNQFDFSQITDYIFLGTNLCCGERSHLEFLEATGVTANIDLEEERQEAPPKIDVYLWLPVKDKSAPNPAQLDAGVALLANLVENKKKVYVHCRFGHGRSPTLVAAYLVSSGLNLDEALQKIKSARPEIHLEDAQLEALKSYEQKKLL